MKVGRKFDTTIAVTIGVWARSSIQAKHLRVLAKGATRPIVKLPHLFTSGLELPDVETLADEIEKEPHRI